MMIVWRGEREKTVLDDLLGLKEKKMEVLRKKKETERDHEEVQISYLTSVSP